MLNKTQYYIKLATWQQTDTIETLDAVEQLVLIVRIYFNNNKCKLSRIGSKISVTILNAYGHFWY